MDTRPIGVFDSGLGGLSTVRALKKILPNEDIVYFGDTGRVPYGTRSRETIETYAAQDIKFLKTFSCKMIVVACGTVSCVAAQTISSLEEPATGITKPAARAAAFATKNKTVAVLGTSATVNSGAFDNEIKKIDSSIQTISVACPLFVPLVENNWINENDEITTAVAERYLEPVLEKGADTIILGCTHFPILSPIIQKVAGEKVKLIDTGLEEAKYVKEILDIKNLRNDNNHKGQQQFYVSDKTQGFCEVANVLLGEDISNNCSFVDIFKVI